MKMTKGKSIVTLLVVLVLLAGTLFTSIVGFGNDNVGSAKDVTLGLDLQGGVSITYETVDKNPSKEDLEDTREKIEKRANVFSSEAEVYTDNDRRIYVEIPGATDAHEVLDEMGKPGSLEFVAAKADGTGGETVLTGEDVKDAQAGSQTSDTGERMWVVQLTLTSEGAKKFGNATAANIGKQIAIMYDEEQISNPTVQNAIYDGNAVITGMPNFEEAEDLAAMIRIGGISLELDTLTYSKVGAKLGEDALDTSLLAGLIGVAIIIVFMIVMFRVPGLAASISLVLYTAIMIIVLSVFREQITLTLPGIAGIILSIGMAVDANVIIFARIKEEIALGKSVRSSIKNGFDKALSAIVDGNVTTLIAAAVLGFVCTGTIRGFAVTLAIGIILSMITALFFTRYILYALFTLGLQSEKLYGRQKERKAIGFSKKKPVFFIIALAAIASGFVAMTINGVNGNKVLNFGLEFMGGTSTTVPFNEDYTIEEIDEKVKPVFSEITGDSNIQAQKVDGTKDVIIKTRELTDEESEKLSEKLVEVFEVNKENIESSTIGSTIGSEMRTKAIIAVLIAVALMLAYIFIRFRDIRFALSSILALLHDVLVVLAFYAIARISVGNTFIACMLTIIGYSINATIVIFDRIRENMGGFKKRDNLAEIVDKSVTQMLSRSIYTSLTTFITVFMLWLLGVSSVKEFAAPLMVGIVAGCFSSVCISGMVWLVMQGRKKKEVQETGNRNTAS